MVHELCGTGPQLPVVSGSRAQVENDGAANNVVDRSSDPTITKADRPDDSGSPASAKKKSPAPAVTTKKAKGPATREEDENGTSVVKKENDGSTIKNEDPSSTAGSAIMTDPSAAQSQVDADLASSRGAQSDAARCCGDLAACASPSDQQKIQQLRALSRQGAQGGSMTGVCQQMESLGDTTGSLQNRLGAACTSRYSNCMGLCSSFETKYSDLQRSCGSCASGSVFAAAISAFAACRTTCAQYGNQGDALARLGINSGVTSGYADYCRRSAGNGSGLGSGMSPSSLASQAALAEAAAERAAAQVGQGGGSSACAANPSAPGCSARQLQNGDAGFTDSKAGRDKDPNFNLPDSGGQELGYSGNPPFPGDANRNGAGGVRPVPNGGGPFSGGAPNPAAQAKPGGGYSGGPINSSSVTDIDRGFLSSGYSAAPVDSSQATFQPEYGNGRSLAGGAGGRYLYGMDLKKYLPGGERYAARRFGANGVRSEINAKEENIWRRVTMKFDEKCRLGVLWRCGWMPSELQIASVAARDVGPRKIGQSALKSRAPSGAGRVKPLMKTVKTRSGHSLRKSGH